MQQIPDYDRIDTREYNASISDSGTVLSLIFYSRGTLPLLFSGSYLLEWRDEAGGSVAFSIDIDDRSAAFSPVIVIFNGAGIRRAIFDQSGVRRVY